MERIRRGTTALTIIELQTMSKRIRDDLEPYIAKTGSEDLSPDTVLELAAFFNRLLSQTTTTALTAYGHSSTKELAYSLKLNDLRVSRIHFALLKITGPATRWPSRLIELSETILKAWTEVFGGVKEIRPLLYERGGRLYEVRAEKEMSRHALLVKWLSDRNSLVSPLRALEHGHLDFRPGQWWIHPIFAFYDGIIDSPDSHGGITADSDGAYAITLTDRDEVESSSPEEFRYRIRREDKGKHRFMQGIVPPKRSVRVLRSHTMPPSPLNPVVGLRYDGLYKISSISHALEKSSGQDLVIRFDVTMQRETDQLPMKEVQKHPTSEEFDDYNEYKRLRLFRLNKVQDPVKRVPKLEQVLGVIPKLQDVGPDLDQEVEPLPTLRRGAEAFWNGLHQNSELKKLGREPEEHSRLADDYGDDTPVTTLDGNQLVPTCSNPSAHEPMTKTANGAPSELKPEFMHSFPAGPIRICCNDLVEDSKRIKEVMNGMGQDVKITFSKEDASIVWFPSPVSCFESPKKFDQSFTLDHEMLQNLKQNVYALVEVTKFRSDMSEEFAEDLTAMLDLVKQWEIQCVSTKGFVDSCLWEVADMLYEAIQCLNIKVTAKSEGGHVFDVCESMKTMAFS